MMTMRPPIAAILLFALAACGQGGEPSANNIAAAAVPADYLERIRAMNEKERNGVLFRAIRDAGRECQGVVRSVTTDPVDGKPGWLASCDDDGQWLVVIGPDGMAAVTNARDLVGEGG